MSTSARIDSVEPIDASAEPGTEPRPSAISSNGGSRHETPSTERRLERPGLRVAALVGGGVVGAYVLIQLLGVAAVVSRTFDGAAAFGSALALVSVGLPWVVFPVWHGLMARAGHRGRSGGSPSPADLVIGVVGLAVVGWLVGLGLGSLHGHAAADARWIGVGTLVSVASIAGAWWVVGAGWLALERRPKAGVGADAVGSWQWRWIAAVLGGGAIAVGGVLVDWSPWAVLALGSLAMAVAVMGRMRFYASHRDHSVLPAASAPTSLARGVTVGVMLAAVLTVDRIVFWLCAREAFAPSHPLYETCLILARASVLPGLCWVAWLVRRDVLSRYRAWTMAQAVGRSTEQVIATRVATARAARGVWHRWLRAQVVITMVCLWLSPRVLETLGLSVGATAMLQRVFVGALFEAGWLVLLCGLWLHNAGRSAGWLLVWCALLHAGGALWSTGVGPSAYGFGYALAAWLGFGSAWLSLARSLRTSAAERWAPRQTPVPSES